MSLSLTDLNCEKAVWLSYAAAEYRLNRVIPRGSKGTRNGKT